MGMHQRKIAGMRGSGEVNGGKDLRSFPPFPAFLERRAQAQGPESLHPAPALREGIIYPDHSKAKQVQPNRGTEDLERRAYIHRIVTWVAAPFQSRPPIPDRADVVVECALD